MDAPTAWSIGLGIAGFLIGLIALVIALWQVRSARNESRVHAELVVIEAFLVRELTDTQPDEQHLSSLFDRLYERTAGLAGGDERLAELIGQIYSSSSVNSE